MQIIVLSMHRSGSSAITGAINLMGAYFGHPSIATRPNWENPKGFWERKDLRAANDRLLFSVNGDWDRVSHFKLNDISPKEAGVYQDSISQVLAELDANLPWVLKEPRLCLLLPLWLPLLRSPVLVIPYRNPLEIARSLQKRNQIPLSAGLALWERYTVEIINAAGQLPHIPVNYRDAVTRPVETVAFLKNRLDKLGIRGLKLPPAKDIQNFIDPALFRHKAGEPELNETLTSFQKKLWSILTSDSHITAEAPLSPSPESLTELAAYELMKSTRSPKK